MDWQFLFFSFSGRINRAKFWAASLILMAAFMVPFMLAVSTLSTVLWILAFLVFVAVTVCGLAVGAKRLHDRDRSAWWLALFYLAPGVLQGLAEAAGGIGAIFYVISFAISIWALVEMGFLRGTAGPNRFGPDPLATTGAQAGGAHPVS